VETPEPWPRADGVRESVSPIVGGALPSYEFKLRPSTPEQERVLRALDDVDGFSCRLAPDTYFHVGVDAASFDEAQYKLRDTVADLEEPVRLSVPVVLEDSSEPRSD
jgi:hypothetical protein